MWISRRRDELAAAIMLLTRLPAWPVPGHDEGLTARAVWAYPVVGAVIGGIGGVTALIAQWAGLSLLVAVLLGLAATLLATGCFHEDGLADFCDGIGGGRTRERKLEIMRDSRIGTYGGAALILSLGLRAAALAAMAPPMVLAVWIAAGALARGGALLLLAVLPAAREDGLARSAGAPPLPSLIAGWAATTLITLAALGASGLILVIAALVASLAVMLLSRRHLGGYTGDALGAAAQAAEIACLVVASSLWVTL
ncbi:adenosylcobinamide-GDP ribazoletransferase [Iodidimonas sp. SYSU 1G8]|uniref:adenosylcobinamide-GDP ribazoletransferase n=1 Tax=Iodidimonas sp. SYSU 1G8 TaxID=3133967 RepID=UPI0031FE5CF3